MANILIIDDSESMCEQIETLARELQHTTRSVTSGRDGCRAAREDGPYDLVITDIFMPDMDGIETIETIKSTAPLSKIIAISGGGAGLSGQAMLEVASGIGADLTMHKPFNASELQSAITSLLSPA